MLVSVRRSYVAPIAAAFISEGFPAFAQRINVAVLIVPGNRRVSKESPSARDARLLPGESIDRVGAPVLASPRLTNGQSQGRLRRATSSNHVLQQAPLKLTAHPKRFAGLDAIRFVCAYMVVAGHNPSFVPYMSQMGRTAGVIGKILRDTINGPAAVIVFFVISGFCIHAPYRAGQRMGLDYFVRRYLRIGIPLAATLVIYPYLGIPVADLIKSVLWSLYCELVYYSLYPLLARAARRVGWPALTALAFLPAFSWAIAWPSPFGDYTTANVFRDSLLGLPCWLMGCLLAERDSYRAPSIKTMWLWRCAVFLASVATLELRFHTRVHFDLSLNFFGILVFFWLSRELGYGQKHLPWSWLERAGAWSYSLYVMHPAAGRVLAKISSNWSFGAQWLIRIPLTLGICYLFYLAVEKPSHRLARVAANALRPPAAAGVPPLA